MHEAGRLIIRLDIFLVKNGLAESRQKAQALIKGGFVTVGSEVVCKPSAQADEDSGVSVRGKLGYVSRGGEKLSAALSAFGISLAGKTAADLGAGTGGFTDCMLQNGVSRVISVDVGDSQLHPRIRADRRVSAMDGVNVRWLTADALGAQVDFLTADLSFISVRMLFPVFAALLKDSGEAVILIKPQFEAGREKLGKKGVIKDKKVHLWVLEECVKAAEAAGLYPKDIIPSPIKGGDGNTEFLILFDKSAGSFPPEKLRIAAGI